MFSSSPLPIIPPSPVAPHFSEPPSEPLVPLLPLLASPVHHRHPSSPPPHSSIINYNNNHNGSSTSSSILCNNINSAPTFDASWGNMSSSHASPTLPVSYGMPHVYQLRRSSSIDHGLTMDAEIGKHHPQPPHLHHLHHHVGDVRDVVVQNTSMDNESDECTSLSADSSGISTNQRTSTDASRTPDVSDTQMHVEDLLFPSHSMKMEATHASHLHPPQTPPPLRRSPLRRASLRREQSFPRDHMTESSNLLSPNASILVQERQQQQQQHHHPAHNVPRPPAWCGGLPPSVPVPSSLKTPTRLNLSVTWASDVDGLEERNKTRRRTSTLEAEQKEQRMLQHLREEEVRQREDGLVHGISLTGQPEVLQRPANHGDWGLASFGTE